MKLADFQKVEGEIIGLQSEDGGKTYTEFMRKKNLITSVGDQNLAQLLAGDSAAYTMGHWAVGDGSSTASRSDTIIDGEYERFAIDTQVVEAITGGYQVENTLDLGPTEGNGTIRKIGLIAHGPTTTLANYNPLDPNEATHEWKLLHYSDVLMPNGKVKDASLTLKFIWRVKFTN